MKAGHRLVAAGACREPAGGRLRGLEERPAQRRESLSREPAGRAAREMTRFNDTGGEDAYAAYALGVGQIYMNRISSHPVWATLGSAHGFGSTLAHVPGNGITVAVLANRDDSARITVAIAEALIETATEAP
jgi:hypothetical protein